MFDLFLDIFSYRENILTRLDPRVKIITALTAIICIILSTHVHLPLITLVLCLSCLLVLKMPLMLLFSRLALPMGFVLVLIALQAYSQGKLTTGGIPVLHAGFLMGSKVLGSLSIMILLGMVTPAHRIFSALRALGIPRGWVELAMLMYRSIFILLEHASEASCAQRVRLGHHGVKRTLSSLGTLAGSVILRSLDQSRQTHEAMLLRGYNGSIPGEPLPRMTGREILFSLLPCLVIICLFLIQEWR